MGAGLLGVPLTGAFLAGRLASYSLHVGGAAVAGARRGHALPDALTSPVGIALQGAMVRGLVLLVRVDWTRALTRGRKRGGADNRADRSPSPGAGAGPRGQAPMDPTARS